MQRSPAVAGTFYPGDTARLRRDVDGCLGDVRGESCVGVVVPHAGYVYSGSIAGETLARVQIPRTILLLGPNHHGTGARAALYDSGSWLTPLGDVPVDADLATRLMDATPLITADPLAHRYEHSLEVQLPFLQVLQPDLQIVPLMLQQQDYGDLEIIGEGIAYALARFNQPVLMVASCDMTHFESADVARAKDSDALEAVLSRNPRQLYDTVLAKRISMCGVVPVTVMLVAANLMGAREGELVRYGHSGLVTGDLHNVVAYAGVVIR